MTGSNDLPEDFRNWPADPYQLLGVSRGASEREIRSAYIRRIKRYKPERHPEEFQILRRAFEQLQSLYELETDQGTLEELLEGFGVQVLSLPADDAPFTARQAESIENSDVSQSKPKRRPDALDEAWRKVFTESPENAYGALCEIESAAAFDPEVCLRIYWLLTGFPQLDEKRSAGWWLARGLSGEGLNGRLWDVYVRYVEGAGDFWTCDSQKRLLELQAGTSRLLELACLRWRTALRVVGVGSRLERILEQDLDLLGANPVFASPYALRRLMLLAADFLVWGKSTQCSEFIKRCMSEMAEADVYDRTSTTLADRLDEANRVAIAWREAGFDQKPTPSRGHLKPAMALIPRFWADSWHVLRPDFLNSVRFAAADPDQLMEDALDLAANHPSLCGFVIEAIPYADYALSERELDSFTLAFIRQVPPTQPNLLRRFVWRYCIAVWLPPDLLLAGVAQSFAPASTAARILRGDLALTLAWRVYSVFWKETDEMSLHPNRDDLRR